MKQTLNWCPSSAWEPTSWKLCFPFTAGNKGGSGASRTCVPKQSLGTSWLLLAALCLALSGCNWNRFFRQTDRYVQPPQVFRAAPTREELIAKINDNTNRVQTLQASGSLSIPKLPSLSTEIAFERPRNLRFKAGTRLLGPELDLGSNNELFWFWANQDPSKALYYARHEQFATSRASQVVPVEPAWLKEAIGLIELDPNGQIEGPITAGDKVQLRVRQKTGAGEVTKILVIDAKKGLVVEQQLFDPRGQLLGSAKASEHEFHQLDGVTLPHKIDIEVPLARLQFQLVLDQHVINRPISGGNTFDLPTAQLSGARPIDIADPNFAPTNSPSTSTTGAPPRTSVLPASSQGNRIRGFNPWK